MLDAKTHTLNSILDTDTSYYNRRCNEIDKKINDEIYGLYDLSKNDIEIIEGG